MENHIAVMGKRTDEKEWGMHVAYSIDKIGVKEAVQKAIEFMEVEKSQPYSRLIEYKLQGMEF